MNCEFHTVAVHDKNGRLYCPSCRHYFSEEEARLCLTDLLKNKKSVGFSLKVFKLQSTWIKTKNPEVKRKISMRFLKLQERYLKGD